MLDPTIPPEGNDFRAYMERKFGDDVDRVHAYVTEVGARAGLTFRFDLIRHAPNSLRAHRLVEVAPEEAREAIVSEIFDRYFAHGQDIGDIEVLADIARLHGMDESIAWRLLKGEDATAGVVASMREAQQAGITGVPFFIFDDRYGVNGAQQPDTLLQVLRIVEEG
jgi:predicted DsbA family dithiol-disulfide isomerase